MGLNFNFHLRIWLIRVALCYSNPGILLNPKIRLDFALSRLSLSLNLIKNKR